MLLTFYGKLAVFFDLPGKDWAFICCKGSSHRELGFGITGAGALVGMMQSQRLDDRQDAHTSHIHQQNDQASAEEIQRGREIQGKSHGSVGGRRLVEGFHQPRTASCTEEERRAEGTPKFCPWANHHYPDG